MRKSHAARRALTSLDQVRSKLRRVSPSRLTHACSNLEDWSGVGYPAGIGESSIGRSRGVCDPTAAAAAAALSREERDEFGHDLAELQEALDTMDAAAGRVEKLVESAISREGEDLQGRIGCKWCERALVDGRRHPEAWQPLYHVADQLCRFDTEFRDRYGMLPAHEITLWHLDNLGRQVPKTMIRQHHPDAFKRYHETHRRAS